MTILVVKQISSYSLKKWNYLKSINLQILYVYPLKHVQINDWYEIVTILETI